MLLAVSCGGEPDRSTETWIRLPLPEPSERVTRHGDARPADTVVPPHTRRLCRPVGTVPRAGTLQIALATLRSPEVETRASLGTDDGGARDVVLGTAWSTVTAPVEPTGSGCVELTITGDPRATVAVAQPTMSSPGLPRPWVILYVFDTLRFDQLVGADGALRAIPAFETLSRDALFYVRAFSPSSWTRPSVASLLTGVGASSHGVYDFSDRLRTDLPTLAAELSRAGYRTVALSTNPNVLPVWGFDEGFDRFVDVVRTESGRADPYGSLEAIGRAVIRESTDAPLFLLVHDNGPHSPYRTPRGYTADVPPPPPAVGDDAKLRRAWERYGRSVEYSSGRLAALTALLQDVGRYDDAILAVVGDHGEAFGEHGHRGHGNALSGVQIHVPLFLKAPRAQRIAGRLDSAVSLVDVAPSVLALLGLEPPDAWRGRALPRMPSPDEPSAGAVVSQLENTWARASAVIRWPWKYLRHDGTESLFDLADDPDETRNVADRHPAILAELRAVMTRERRPAITEVVLECVAGAEDARVDLTLWIGEEDTPADVERRHFEPSDRAEQRGEALELSLDLPQHSSTRGAALFGRDRDQIRVRSVTRERVRVRIRQQGDGDPALVGPDDAPLPTAPQEILLADVTTALRPDRLAPGMAPRCRLHRTSAEAGTTVETVPEDVAQRLRALGYM